MRVNYSQHNSLPLSLCQPVVPVKLYGRELAINLQDLQSIPGQMHNIFPVLKLIQRSGTVNSFYAYVPLTPKFLKNNLKKIH